MMKMKKWMGACAIASMVLTQAPVSVLANEFDTVYQTEADETKSQLQQQIEKAKDGDVIQIQGENTGSISIPNNKKLTLQFASGAKLINTDKQDTITIGSGAVVTITGAGSIVNNSHAKAALNNNGGTVTLEGGITVARPSDEYNENGNKNSYYTVVNHGTLTVNQATISNAGNYSSCVENGWYNSKDIPNNKQTVAKLTINNGANISGGLNTIKNDENGELKITGGTITSTNQYAIMNWNKAEITGGYIENNNPNAEPKVKAAIHNGNDSDTSIGKMTISGNAVVKGETAVFTKSTAQDGGLTISGGEIKGSLKVDDQAKGKVTVNGGSFTEKLPEGIQPGKDVHVHKIQKVSKAPTCTESGVEDHYECTECHKTFADEKGQNDVTPTVIPATGHTYTWVIDKEPTKDHAGSKYQYCVVCHHKADPVSIPAIGYTEKVESAVYRAYNPNNGEHLYTANYDEFRTITNIGWHDEGIAFMTESAKDGNPLYRVYNPNNGLHHYTIDENEKNVLVSLGWKDEDVTMYTSKKPQCAAVFRVYNPNGGQHHYTKDANERNVLVSLGWKDEGIAFRTAEIPTK